jgi:hypothetical protein
MSKKIEVTAADAKKIETFNKAFPVGTECAVVQDDGTRKIMFIIGAALPGKDGIKAEVGTAADAKDGTVTLIARIRARSLEKKPGKDQLRVDLTDVERIAFGNEMADQLAVASQLKDEMKGQADLFKGKIAAAEAIIKSKSDLLRAGYDIRPVDCETVIDFDRGRAIKRRKDLGAVIEDRPLRPDEMNRELVLFPEAQKEEPKPAEETPADSATAEAPKPSDIPKADLQRALDLIRETKRASETSIRKALNIGTTRAVQILDALEAYGVVGPAKGNGGPRDIINSEVTL